MNAGLTAECTWFPKVKRSDEAAEAGPIASLQVAKTLATGFFKVVVKCSRGTKCGLRRRLAVMFAVAAVSVSACKLSVYLPACPSITLLGWNQGDSLQGNKTQVAG